MSAREAFREDAPLPSAALEVLAWIDSGDATRERLESERNRYIRLFNRLEAAVSHHKKAHLPQGRYFADDPDEALWKARDKILKDACAGQG